MAVSRGGPIARAIVAILCLMLVLFPKGGMRIGGLPLTWGYLFLFLAFLGLMPYRILAVRARFLTSQVVAALCLVPFLLVTFYAFFAYGIVDGFSRNGFISTLTALLFLPMLFLWFFPPLMPLVDGKHMMRIICFCMLAAALFGIFLFIWKPLTGSFVQIPYLTINADDVDDFSVSKNISRGFVLKLISTYNNGNIYGAATFILLPLFDRFSPQTWKRWVMRLALVLTLSRTIWAGLIFDQLLGLVALLARQRHTFPRVRLGSAAKILLILAAMIPVFVLTVQLIGIKSNFLLDSSLGGRTTQFQHLGSASWIPTSPSPFMFSEVTYLSAINLYGLIGFPVISLVLLSPLVVLLFDRSSFDDPIRRAALRGLLLYAFVSTSDGALDYIPIMAFYWFTYMIFLFGVPNMGGIYPTVIPVSRAPAI